MSVYICKDCGEEYISDRAMRVETITTNGGCDWADTDTYYYCKCGDLLGTDGGWYCNVL